MRTEYDFGSLTARKNPYVRLLKQPVTIRLDRETVAYFKAMARQTGLPYQQLINLYLRDCAVKRRHLQVSWEARPAARAPARRADRG